MVMEHGPFEDVFPIIELVVFHCYVTYFKMASSCVSGVERVI